MKKISIANLNHASFTVSDLDKSIDFYQNVLGLKIIDKSFRDQGFSEKVTGIKDAKLKIAYFQTTNCSIELIEYLSPAGTKIDTTTCNVGSAHVCFYVRGFVQAIELLRKNHVSLVGEPTIIPAGPNKGKGVVYFEDPDSNKIEFISYENIQNGLELL